MTQNYKKYTTEGFKYDNYGFGGIIEDDDFNTYEPNKNRIKNQMDAVNMQMEYEAIKEMEKNGMTLERLKEMKLISNTEGRPSSDLTDKKWQEEFRLRKLFIKPYPENITKYGGKYSKEYPLRSENSIDAYCGATNYQEYSRYINDVLSNIRAGQVDYTYYIYQIIDLLKFHYNTLKTRYCDGYWEVWLER